jgi:hypothetical protein
MSTATQLLLGMLSIRSIPPSDWTPCSTSSQFVLRCRFTGSVYVYVYVYVYVPQEIASDSYLRLSTYVLLP